MGSICDCHFLRMFGCFWTCLSLNVFTPALQTWFRHVFFPFFLKRGSNVWKLNRRFYFHKLSILWCGLSYGKQDVKWKFSHLLDCFFPWSLPSNVCKYPKTWLSVYETVLLQMFLMSHRQSNIMVLLKSQLLVILEGNHWDFGWSEELLFITKF
jgi:hypothetical protein